VGQPVTEADFGRMLATFERCAFRLETCRHYALGYERADFEDFLAGRPVSPPELDWWRPWLDQIRQQVSNGKTIARVRVLDEPPTPYQQWEMWAAPWHKDAGEDIRYMPRSRAEAIGVPMGDWWLLDESRLILMRFTDSGEIAGKELVTDPAVITSYLAIQRLAVHDAATVEGATVA
jgi:hypothetical protein